jgi:hypothetical protein
LDPKDDTQTSGGLGGGQTTSMADKTISMADEPVQANPDVPAQATEPAQPVPIASVPKAASIPTTTPTTPISSGVTAAQPTEPVESTEPATFGTTSSGLSQEEPMSTTPDVPTVDSGTEETGVTTTGSMPEPMGKTSTDDSNTSGGGISSL